MDDVIDEFGQDPFQHLPSGEGVLILSLKGTVLSANLPAEKILRTTLEPGQSLAKEQIFTTETITLAELAIREATQGGTSRSDLRGEMHSGPDSTCPVEYSVFPLRDLAGKISGIMLTFRELFSESGGRPSQKSVCEIEYGTLFENLAEGVFTVNFKMRITSFNRRAQELTGYSAGEVMGRFCWEIFQSDLCQGCCPLRSSMESERAGMDQDVRIISKEGRRLSLLVNTSVMKNEQGQVVGAVETFRPLINHGLTATDSSQTKALEDSIIGGNPLLTAILDKLPEIAQSEVSVVIEGESGTGKELIAKAIHSLSPNNDGPFIAVNTSALAETLLESELFGHEKGAFTGAAATKAGRFELARGGTLFLDEIAEIKPSIQVKLLRVIEEGQFERVGGIRPITMDCRIICATNRCLVEDVRKGRFRTDLFYRLRTVSLTLPPLRDRLDDLPVLIDHFIKQLNKKHAKRVRGLDPKVLPLFRRYHWPGNIRELKRVLEYAFVFVKGPIITLNLIPTFEETTKLVQPPPTHPPLGGEIERNTIVKALNKAGGRRQEAARILGISRTSLWRKMKDYGL